MNIGEIIKKLRKQKDMTQEQLAEYLNISPQAVSRWEINSTLPDITLLPALANIFNVTSDVLLGIDVINKEKQIGDIIVNAEKIRFTDSEKAVSILREGLKEYPNSFEIMERLMSCIHSAKLGKPTDETLILTNEIIELGEKILAECTEDKYRFRALNLLCFAYSSPEAGMTEKAIELAEKLPKNDIDRESLLAQLYEGEKKFKQLQKNMLLSFEKLINSANDLNISFFNGNEKSEIYGNFTIEEFNIIQKKIITLIEIMIEDGNYGYFGLMMFGNCLNLAVHYAKTNDYDKAMEYLQRSADNAIKIDTEYDTFSEYTSLLLKGTPSNTLFIRVDSFSMNMLERMKDTAFNPIRENKTFIEIEEKLKKYAKDK